MIPRWRVLKHRAVLFKRPKEMPPPVGLPPLQKSNTKVYIMEAYVLKRRGGVGPVGRLSRVKQKLADSVPVCLY